jgi:hypothetical protein
MDAIAAIFGLGVGWLWFVLMFATAGIGLAGTALWIWMLVDVLTKESDENNNRLIWALVIIFTHWVGALIYLIVRRPARTRQLGK